MNKIAIILTALFLIILCGCRNKLDNNDLAWLVYNAGDTLIFESPEHIFDTTYILKKEILYPPYNPIEVHGKYHPQIGEIYYYNKDVPYINGLNLIVYLEKKDPNKKADGFISYLDATFFFDCDYFNLTNESITFKGIKYNDIIKITSSYKINLTCDELRTLWWSKKVGLLRYETCEGQIWLRVK